MAVSAGAELWHMNCVAAGFGYKVPGLDAAWMCRLPAHGFLLVDQRGARFVNEQAVEHHAAAHALAVRDFRTGRFMRLPSFLIFDERTRLAGPIAGREAGANRQLTRSPDNRIEIERGWIARAETVEGLAKTLRLDPETLGASVRDFNRAAGGGSDVLGRPREQMVASTRRPITASRSCPLSSTRRAARGGTRRAEC